MEDEALDWLKPRALIKPDDQEDVPEAVIIYKYLQSNNPHFLIYAYITEKYL